MIYPKSSSSIVLHVLLVYTLTLECSSPPVTVTIWRLSFWAKHGMICIPFSLPPIILQWKKWVLSLNSSRWLEKNIETTAIFIHGKKWDRNDLRPRNVPPSHDSVLGPPPAKARFPAAAAMLRGDVFHTTAVSTFTKTTTKQGTISNGTFLRKSFWSKLRLTLVLLMFVGFIWCGVCCRSTALELHHVLFGKHPAICIHNLTERDGEQNCGVKQKSE